MYFLSLILNTQLSLYHALRIAETFQFFGYSLVQPHISLVKKLDPMNIAATPLCKTQLIEILILITQNTLFHYNRKHEIEKAMSPIFSNYLVVLKI